MKNCNYNQNECGSTCKYPNCDGANISKELSAEEFHIDKLASEGYNDESIDKFVKEFYKNPTYLFAEKYANYVATARLKAYKAEQKQRLEFIDRYAHEIMMDNDNFKESDEWINASRIRGQVHHLTDNTRASEYTEAEQNCEGCMGPCGQCETKKESDESK